MKNKDKTATKMKNKRKYKLVGEQPCSMNVYVDKNGQIRSVGYEINKAKQKERKKVLKEVIKIVENEKWHDILDKTNIKYRVLKGLKIAINKDYADGYNQALKDIISILKESK